MVTSNDGAQAPIPYQQPVSWPKAIFFRNFAPAFRWLANWDVSRRKSRNPDYWEKQEPDFRKTYPIRPMLVNRIFIPANRQPEEKYPIFILIHGGGWVIGDPSMDDEQARMLADQHLYVVASLEYRLAPQHPFPTAIHDVAALTLAVLEDRELPIDTNKVVVGGFSAGAVMTLNLAQLPELQDKIKALVPFQPLTDRSGSVRGPWKTTKWGDVDQLKYTSDMFQWSYVPPGTDLTNKMLSPLYANRDDIPQPLFIVTGGADTLCEEGSALAKKLAGVTDDRDPVIAWGENGVRYYCAPDMPHCWTHFWVDIKGDWGIRQKEYTQEAWKQVTSWLSQVLDHSS